MLIPSPPALPQGIRVDVVCAIFAEDADVVAPWVLNHGFKAVTMNASVTYALPQFKHPAKLPFMNAILYAGYLHGEGEYRSMVKVAVLARPQLATTGSSDCVRRLEAALRIRRKGPGASDPSERP